MQYEEGKVYTDNDTQAFYKTKLGKLKQIKRIKLQWLCRKYGVPFNPETSTAQEMRDKIASLGIAIPHPDQITRPADEPVKIALKQQSTTLSKNEAASHGHDIPPAQSGAPVPKWDGSYDNLKFFELKAIAAEKGMQVEARTKKAEILEYLRGLDGEDAA